MNNLKDIDLPKFFKMCVHSDYYPSLYKNYEYLCLPNKLIIRDKETKDFRIVIYDDNYNPIRLFINNKEYDVSSVFELKSVYNIDPRRILSDSEKIKPSDYNLMGTAGYKKTYYNNTGHIIIFSQDMKAFTKYAIINDLVFKEQTWIYYIESLN